MTNDLSPRNLVATGQLDYKFFECVKLSFGGSFLFEISDQADADSAGVDQSIPGVSAVELLIPAKRGLHLTIRHAAAIADHKVVGNAQPRVAVGIPPLLMFAVDGLHASRTGPGMMNHQILPRAVGQLPFAVRRLTPG